MNFRQTKMTRGIYIEICKEICKQGNLSAIEHAFFEEVL